MMQLAEHILPAEGVDLGPARVLADAAGRDVSLALESGASVTAQLALALPYRAVEGDVVLVLSKGARHYVVGVLEGSGLTQLTFRGAGADPHPDRKSVV